MPTPTKRNQQPSLSPIPYSAACRRVNVLSRLYGIYRDLAQCVGGASSRAFSLFLSLSLSVLPSFSSRSTHTHSVPRERNSRSTVIKILRASAERYSARNRVNMRETFFFSFLLFPLISCDIWSKRLNGVLKRIRFFPFWPTDGTNFSIRSRLISYYRMVKRFVRPRERRKLINEKKIVLRDQI